MRTYKVRSGDTLAGIARKFGVSMMTVWWANHLRRKDDLHIGQTLAIPPVSGVVVTVTSADTLDALAAKYERQGDRDPRRERARRPEPRHRPDADGARCEGRRDPDAKAGPAEAEGHQVVGRLER